MTVIHVQSIQDAVNKGALIELASDYRTSRTVRAWLPKQTPYPFAISTAAYHQHVEQGTAGEKLSRTEALCVFLSKAVGLDGQSSRSNVEVRPPGNGGKLQEHPLKLEWYAPNNYWVILLADEQIQPGVKLA